MAFKTLKHCENLSKLKASLANKDPFGNENAKTRYREVKFLHLAFQLGPAFHYKQVSSIPKPMLIRGRLERTETYPVQFK